MNNVPALLKTLIIYAVIVPLAIFVGYTLTNPLDYSTFAYGGVVALVLLLPLLMRWHYPWLLFSWRVSMVLFFMKGSPSAFIVMVVLSLGISVAERAMDTNKHFIRVPQVTLPLICMIAVVFFTAKMTGGFGLRSFGGDVYGGKKYVTLLIGILGYFALTARRIPADRVNFYIALFFLSQVTCMVSDLYPVTPSFLHPIFWLIPPSSYNYFNGEFEIGRTRLGGVGLAGLAVLWWMMARFGLRGILLSGKTWRPILFFLATVMIFMGGFRSALLEFGAVFLVLFFLEGLQRTRLMPVMVMIGIAAVALAIPLASKLPFVFQRAMTFLPLNLSHEARAAAEDSTKWRVDMWKALLPQIPKHILLGKGYAISMEDYEFMGLDSAFHSVDAGQDPLALSADYHNGPLSVILPFGIWGVIVLLWFMFVALRVMYFNFRYGDPSLQTINTFLWVSFAYACFKFLFLGGGLASDMAIFTGLLGLGIALNGGMCRPAPQSAQIKQPANLVKPFPRPRPAFQRYRAGL